MKFHQEENVRVLPRELQFRIQRTVNALEKISSEQRRGVFENVLQFAEFHPRPRLGLEYMRELPGVRILSNLADTDRSLSRPECYAYVGKFDLSGFSYREKGIDSNF